MTGSPSLLAALLLATTLGQSCGSKSEPTGSLDQAIERTHDADICVDYCNRAAVCEEGVQMDACVSDCQDSLSNCSDSQRREAAEAIDACAMNRCSEFLSCTIAAGLQCADGT